jgi:hypothetical protein
MFAYLSVSTYCIDRMSGNVCSNCIEILGYSRIPFSGNSHKPNYEYRRSKVNK